MGASSTFVFTRLVSDPHADIITAALGVSSAAPFGENDIGKGVKLSTAQNYVPLATGNDIEGVVRSLEPWTVNSGFTLGSVQRNKRVEAIVASDQGATAMAAGDYVVAGVPIALGTAGILQVKTGAGSVYKWRCLRVMTGTGVAGDRVLIERVNG